MKGVFQLSQLLGIIQRLKTMQEATDQSEAPQRRFEVNGKALCQVKYFLHTDTFELEVFGDDHKYQFDDLDITAIEIFDLVQEEKQSH